MHNPLAKKTENWHSAAVDIYSILLILAIDFGVKKLFYSVVMPITFQDMYIV